MTDQHLNLTFDYEDGLRFKKGFRSGESHGTPVVYEAFHELVTFFDEREIIAHLYLEVDIPHLSGLPYYGGQA